MGFDPFISVKTLSCLLARADPVIVLDVRLAQDAAEDPLDLPGALHGAWNSLPALPLDREVVVYCQRGGKVSQIAAALLRRAGLRARVLRGGHVAWRAASLPLVARIVPEPNLALVPFGAEREGTVAVAADQLDAAAHLTGWAIRRPCA